MNPNALMLTLVAYVERYRTARAKAHATKTAHENALQELGQLKRQMSTILTTLAARDDFEDICKDELDMHTVIQCLQNNEAILSEAVIR